MSSNQTPPQAEEAVLLIGAGGHAKTIVRILAQRAIPIAGITDPTGCDWLDATMFEEAALLAATDFGGLPGTAVIGIGGMTPQALSARQALMDRYAAQGWWFPPLTSPSADVAEDAHLAPGAIIGAMAHVGPNAKIGAGALINTGAVIEHDAQIGPGAHIGPNATILGGARVGAHTMVGAGAVVLPGAQVADASLVKALSVHKG